MTAPTSAQATPYGMSVDIRVSAEFRAQIPALRSKELEQLEANLLRDGCRDPLVVWKEERILLDGHHRLEICRRLDIRFDVAEVRLPDADAAADWIDQHQLGRRNLTPDQMSLLRGRRYNRAKRQGARTDRTSDHNDQKLETAARLGAEHGVSAPTIRRDGRFASAVEALKEADPDLEQRVVSGKGGPRKSIVLAAALWGDRPELARAVLEGKKDLKAVRRELQREDLARRLCPAAASGVFNGSLADLVRAGRRFGTIYADPPWRYGNTSSRGAAENHYPTMSLEELRELPIADLAAEACHLHLWATVPLLPEALDLLRAWGFEYRGEFVWAKPQIGLGNYWRVSTESLLLGVRGSFPFADKAQRNWLELPRTKHSKKPEKIRQIIELVSPGPRLELFGRRAADGWTVWGNEVAPAEVRP